MYILCMDMCVVDVQAVMFRNKFQDIQPFKHQFIINDTSQISCWHH